MKNWLWGVMVITILLPVGMAAQKWDTLAPIPESFTFPVVVAVNGKIHIMGGGGSGGATDHHLVYDPATDTWDTLAPVPYLAQQPAGAAAGKFIHYFGGGYPNSGTPLADHYIYNDSTNTWTKAANLVPKRAIHYGVALNNIIYTLAGQGVANLCQTYDDTADVWITKNNLPDNGFWYGAHVVTNGHIYRFCGGGYTAPNKLANRYDPLNDNWVSLPMFPDATHGISGAAIGNKIYLAGGYHDFLERDEVWIYDTETQQYTAGVPLPIGRNYHNMVSIDSCIYVLGGNNAIDPTVHFQLLRFCPDNTTAVRPDPLITHFNVTCQDGVLAFAIPENATGPLDLDVYDLSGHLIFSRQLQSGQTREEVTIGDLPSTIYLVQLKTPYQLYTGKFVVLNN
jgi:N-acetylneuraminic acid mutarotase